MKHIFLIAVISISLAFFSACGHKHNESEDHEQHEHCDGHNHDEHDHENEDHNHESEMKEGENPDIVVFTGEQVKNILDFKVEKINKQTFYQVLKTSGQILSAPGDEVQISATMSGIVNISIPKLVEGYELKLGQQLFTISSRNLSENNTSMRLSEAKVILETAKAEFERAKELSNEKIISKKEFQQAQLAYEQARLNYQTYASGMSASGKSISTPLSGYLKNISVQSGHMSKWGRCLQQLPRTES